MQLPIHIVDAFTLTRFRGNQAAVVRLPGWLPDETLQGIASENNLSETSFLVWSDARQAHEIRWFSPMKEISFCGHATLASAFVLFDGQPPGQRARFWAAAVGVVETQALESGRISMVFPRRDARRLDDAPQALKAGLHPAPREYWVNQQAYMAVYDTEADVRAARADMNQLRTLNPLDVVITAPASDGGSHDFVSRYFWPANGGDEDPVTGSIHTALAPYWAGRLGRSTLVGLQASKRTGLVYCEVTDEAVEVSGHCVAYLQGVIEV